MLRRALRSGLLVALALGLVGPAAAALPGSSAPDRLRAADDDALVVARRSRRKRSKKKPPAKPEAAPAPPAPAPPPAPEEDGGGAIMSSRRGPARVDFDDRLIQGQTNKSGAIYIFERKSSELHSMVRRRTSFRDEILRSID